MCLFIQVGVSPPVSKPHYSIRDPRDHYSRRQQSQMYKDQYANQVYANRRQRKHNKREDSNYRQEYQVMN